jgi:hypothetical protein
MAYFDKGVLVLESHPSGCRGGQVKFTEKHAKVLRTLPDNDMSLTAEDVGEAIGSRYHIVLGWLRQLYYMGLVRLASRGSVPSTTTASLWRVSAEGKRVVSVFSGI